MQSLDHFDNAAVPNGASAVFPGLVPVRTSTSRSHPLRPIYFLFNAPHFDGPQPAPRECRAGEVTPKPACCGSSYTYAAYWSCVPCPPLPGARGSLVIRSHVAWLIHSLTTDDALHMLIICLRGAPADGGCPTRRWGAAAAWWSAATVRPSAPCMVRRGLADQIISLPANAVGRLVRKALYRICPSPSASHSCNLMLF